MNTYRANEARAMGMARGRSMIVEDLSDLVEVIEIS